MEPEDIARRARELSGTPAQMAERLGALIRDYPRELGAESVEADRRKRRLEIQANDFEIMAAKRRLAHDFGKLHGWRLTRRQFDVTALAGRKQTYGGRVQRVDWPHEFADHPFHYVESRRAAALVSHPYNVDPTKPEKIMAWAESMALVASFPDFPSWWFPGRTALVMFRRAA